MSSQVLPTVSSALGAAAVVAGFKSAHNGHPLTHVGQVVNPSKVRQDLDVRGGIPTSFDVWYCQTDHLVFMDHAS